MIVLVLGLLLIAGISAAIVIGSGLWKPRNIDVIFDRVYDEILASEPTFVRANVEPIIVHNKASSFRLIDYSVEAVLKRSKAAEDWGSYLIEVDQHELTQEKIVSMAILKNELVRISRSKEFEPYMFPISHVWGPHLENEKLFSILPLRSKSDIESYLELLHEIEPQFGSVVDAMEIRRKQNITLPTFILKQVINQCDRIGSSVLDSTVFIRSFEDKLNAISLIDPLSKGQYLNDCKAIVGGSVIPAYKRLTAYLLQLERPSLSISGAWQFPNGNEYYKYCINRHTESTNEPATLYEIAKVELSWIEGEMEIIKELTRRNEPSLISAESISEIQMDLLPLNGINWYISALATLAVSEGWSLYSAVSDISRKDESSTIRYLSYLRRNKKATCAMLIDLGIHEKKWLREQAIGFYLKHIGGTELEATEVVDRIIVDPGKATAAKIGLMRYLELEKLAKEKLKNEFDPIEFREMLSRNGPTTFEFLEIQVNDYLNSKIP